MLLGFISMALPYSLLVFLVRLHFDFMSHDAPYVSVSFASGRTRRTANNISVSFGVPGVANPTMADGAAAPSLASLAAVVNANNLPRDALKLDKFEGRPQDRRFAASWLLRCERIHNLLGYTDTDNSKKLALASGSLPPTSAAGQWFDSKQNDPNTAFADWASFRAAFLTRFGPRPQDLLVFEQQFQRLTQGADTVAEFVQRLDKERDFLAAHKRIFDDTAIRNILISGLRKAISAHVSSVLSLQPTADYEVCVGVASSHPEAEVRGAHGAPSVRPRVQRMHGQYNNNRQGQYNRHNQWNRDQWNRGQRHSNKENRPPRDTSKFCTYHNIHGHTLEECFAARRAKPAEQWRKNKQRQ